MKVIKMENYIVNKTRYELTSYKTYLPIKLEKYFVTGYKCDVVFTTKKDNQKIAAHKLILECVSEYFATMFNTELNNNNDSTEYVINNIDGPIFRTIVQSLYTNNVTVTDDNCMKLFEAAHLMLLTEIEYACTKFMCNNISIENCLHFFAFAQVYSKKNISEVAIEFIFKNFTEVAKSEEFLKLPVNIMECLLNSTGFHCPSEEVIFEAFKDWIEHDLDNRKYYINQLISLIKLPLMKKEYFWDVVDKWNQENMDYKDQLIARDIGKWHAVQKINSDLKIMTISRKFADNFIFTKYSPKVEWPFQLFSFDKKFNHQLFFSTEELEAGNKCLIYDNVYTIFVYDTYYESMWKFCLITLQFTNCYAALSAGSSEATSLCLHNQNIYLFHSTGTSLRSEKFNIKENEMITLNTMYNVSNIIHVATLNDNIYLVESKTPNVLKQYNIQEETLTDVATMQKISGFCKLAVVDGVLYAIGGDKTVECFNPDEKYFVILRDGINNKKYDVTCVCVRNKKINCLFNYVFLPNNDRELIEFDTVKKTWKTLLDLPFDPTYGYIDYYLVSINQ